LTATRRALPLELRLSGPRMTLVLALHDQQAGQLSWTPDTVVRLRPQGSISDTTFKIM
jgi:hypothetical protein